jgi:hypothetical protein
MMSIGFYKGNGCRSEGRITSRGRFIVDRSKRTELVVPDLTGFKVALGCLRIITLSNRLIAATSVRGSWCKEKHHCHECFCMKIQLSRWLLIAGSSSIEGYWEASCFSLVNNNSNDFFLLCLSRYACSVQYFYTTK